LKSAILEADAMLPVNRKVSSPWRLKTRCGRDFRLESLCAAAARVQDAAQVGPD